MGDERYKILRTSETLVERALQYQGRLVYSCQNNPGIDNSECHKNRNILHLLSLKRENNEYSQLFGLSLVCVHCLLVAGEVIEPDVIILKPE